MKDSTEKRSLEEDTTQLKVYVRVSTKKLIDKELKNNYDQWLNNQSLLIDVIVRRYLDEIQERKTASRGETQG